MALLFCDGFDYYAIADIALRWNDNGGGFSAIAANGRNGSNAASLSTGGGGWIKRTCPNASGDTVIVGFAYKPTTLAYDRLLRIDTLGAINAIALVQSSGRLNVGFPGGTMTSTTVPLILNTWVYLELKVVIANAGSATLRANGEVIGTFSGDTQAGATATWDQVGFGQSANAEAGGYIDDFYVCDGTGATNNDFLGDVSVKALIPTGVGNYSQFTPSAGANWQNVDDATSDSDTTYNTATASGQIDTYEFSNLPASGIIHAIQTINVVRKTDAGSRRFVPVTRSGGSNYDLGSQVAVGDSYWQSVQISEINPATGVAWTTADVDGAEFGIRVSL